MGQEKKDKLNLFRRIALPYNIGTNIYDIKTTNDAINSGFYESNPLYGSNPGLTRLSLTKAATIGPSLYFLDKLSKSHPKLALGLGLAAGSVPLIAGLHNRSILNKKKE
jgi:hypothetical protein